MYTFGMHTSNTDYYVYNVYIDTQIQTHMKMWTVIKI